MKKEKVELTPDTEESFKIYIPGLINQKKIIKRFSTKAQQKKILIPPPQKKHNKTDSRTSYGKD